MDADGVVVIKTILDNSDFDKDVKDLETKGSKVGDKIKSSLNSALKRATGLGKGLGNSFLKIISIVGKLSTKILGMGLLMSGLVAGVGLLSMAFKEAGKDEQLRANLDYIKYMLTTALQPVIAKIVGFVKSLVDLLYRVLMYVRYIINAWTGYDIFGKASLDGYNKGLKDANKNAKELKRTLAGFDEMNTLQDNSQSGAGASAGAGAMPKMEDVPIPGWVEWIGKHGKEILAIFSGIAAALVAIKLGVKGIKALGIGIFVTGIVHAIQSLLAYLDNPSWENFGKIIEGVGIAVLGLALVFGSVPLAVAGAIALILGLLIHFWDDIKKFINNILQAIYDFGDNAMKFLSDKFGIFGTMLGTVVNTAVGVVTSAIEMILDVFDGLFTGVKGIFDGIIMIFKGDFKNGLISIGKGIVNALIGILNGLIDGVNLILSPLRAAIVGIGFISGQNWSMDDIKIPRIPKLATGAIVNNPGQGVMMGNYIAGERGSEAVLPLDDFTMDRLGMAIARHMNINNDNKIYLNARQIARQMNITNNETDFAYNR